MRPRWNARAPKGGSVRIVDTSVFVDAERGHGPAVERIAELLVRGELAVSAVTVFELMRGPTTPRRLLAHYAELFGREAVVFPVTHSAAQLAAEAARAGGGIKAPDALIAGTALEQGAPVVTSDADFRRVPGLLLEWVPGAPVAHEPEAAYGRAAWRERTAARIRELRESAGMRAAEVAAAAGMARSNYARLESGRHQLSLGTLERVARAVRVPLAELIEPRAGRGLGFSPR
jgi:predicted nucleic acid-binding protein/DNA-binding XRE family transcriptional regulator